MKYFTVASICIVVVLFIALAKEIEMKSLARAEIQDGKLRTITDPMTDLKDIMIFLMPFGIIYSSIFR